MAIKSYSYGRQTISRDDIKAVVKVLKSDWLTQGPQVGFFEEALGKKFKAKHASVVCNGTAGLHLIGLAMGWGKGDIVITTPITFLASANCILYAGASPDFVDIEHDHHTIDTILLEKKIKENFNKGKKVKAVIGVDYAGHPCDWESLRSLADRYQFQLVNDNCHALGAEYKEDIGYAAKYADAVNLSFHPVKHITTGEGGAVLTDNQELDIKIKILRTHGMTKDSALLEKMDGPWYYEMHELGYNYRITDFQCALGSSQIRKLDKFVSKRRTIAKYYDAFFVDQDHFIVPKVDDHVKHAYHLYPLQIKFEEIQITKRELFNQLQGKGIHVQVHYIPIHLQPFYKKNYNFREGDFPVAEQFYTREVSIPIYPSLKLTDSKYIARVIKEMVR